MSLLHAESHCVQPPPRVPDSYPPSTTFFISHLPSFIRPDELSLSPFL